MALVMTAAPAAEPISVAEAKVHLRVDVDEEDALIASLIVAARMLVEKTLARALLTQSWSLFLDTWPRSGMITLPIAPVQGVTVVRIYDKDDTPAEVDAANYAVDRLSEPARLVPTAAVTSPARRLNSVEVAFNAGYGDDAGDVPEPIRQALRLLVAHWFEHREPVVLGDLPQDVPGTIASLLLPYRQVRL
jgi:uncharacterized phiE125 gp8 family phage protein